MTRYSGNSNSTDESEEDIHMMGKTKVFYKIYISIKSNITEWDHKSFNENMLIYTFLYATRNMTQHQHR